VRIISCLLSCSQACGQSRAWRIRDPVHAASVASTYAIGPVGRHTWTMDEHREFSQQEAREIGERIGIDTKVSGDDEITTGKIVWAHLTAFPDYCARLPQMEAAAERCWAKAPHENGRRVTRLLNDMFSFRQRPEAPHQPRLARGALRTGATAVAVHRNPEGARLRPLAPGHLR